MCAQSISKRYYQHPFFGLLLYLLSHIFLIYYLIWMLVPHLPNWPFLDLLFPPQAMRMILPAALAGFLCLYFCTVWVLRRMKLAEQAAFL